jgi:hypothetical protein
MWGSHRQSLVRWFNVERNQKLIERAQRLKFQISALSAKSASVLSPARYCADWHAANAETEEVAAKSSPLAKK